MERKGSFEAALTGCRDNRVVTRLQRVESGQLERTSREHHAWKVVVGEDERLLDRTRCRDVALGADLVKRAALPDRNHPVEVSERWRIAQDFDSCRFGFGG